MKNKGFTTIEVLVSCAIFFITLVLATSMLVQEWKYYIYIYKKSAPLSAARMIVYKISDDVMMADKIYSLNDGENLITLARKYRSGNNFIWHVIGYKAKKAPDASYDIYRVEYPVNYSGPAAPVISRTLLGNAIKGCGLSNDPLNNNIYSLYFAVALSDKEDFKLSNKINRKK